MFEIGPGKGIITRQLSKKAANVIAAKYDKNLTDGLWQMLADHKNVEIIFY